MTSPRAFSGSPSLQYPVGLIPEAAAGRKHKRVGVAEGGADFLGKRECEGVVPILS